MPVAIHHTAPSHSSLSLQATIRHITDQGPVHTSKTWTNSSGDHNILNDTDELDDRAAFVQEYNRLAKKNGVRILVIDDFDFRGLDSPRKQGWIYRILRSSSNQNGTDTTPPAQGPRHKRSVSDLAHNLVHRRETPKMIDLQSMIRISGKSMFYLPAEHAPSALVLPTCLRATAHHLAQHVTTRGIFRIPGSIRVVNMLFDYYCCTEHGQVDITSTTVRCANLPMHVQASVHDVASTFKRLLSVIPGGILGSLSLFDAFVAIHSQLQGDPEFPRTKHTKVRARLIALAIGTVESQFRRELICAVFGLLSLIGRVAEISPREDDDGRTLPTGDLMGYNALGIVFGPLLLGDLLGLYSMKLATPKTGLLVLPLRSPKSRQDRRIRKTLENELPSPPTMDKILVANTIAEMLIANWRDVVRQMQSLGINRHEPRPISPTSDAQENNFVIRKPVGWDREWRDQGDDNNREMSPEPPTPTLGMPKQRSRNRSSASRKLGIKPSIGYLSPTVEEAHSNEEELQDTQSYKRDGAISGRSIQTTGGDEMEQGRDRSRFEATQHNDSPSYIAPTPTPITRTKRVMYRDSPRVSEEDVPPRTSSKRSTPLHRISVEEKGSQDKSSFSAKKDSTPIERKGAIRKKHPEKGKLQKTPRHSVAVEWPESAARSDISTDKRDSQTTQLEFPSEKEALDAALKAHFDELRELDSAEQNKHSPLDADDKQKLQVATIGLESGIAHHPMISSGASGGLPRAEQGNEDQDGRSLQHQTPQTSARRSSSRVVSLPAETPRTESSHGESTPWFSIPGRNSMSLKRPSLSTEHRRGVKAMAAKFEGGDPGEVSPTLSSSPSKTHALISQFEQESPPITAQSTRSVSTGRRIRQDSVQSQNTTSRNPSAANIGDQVNEQDLRVSIGEAAAMKAVELQKTDKERKLSKTYPQPLTLRQTMPRRKPVPEKGEEASLKDPGSLGTMMPNPEQPPIAQHLNFMRPSSSTSNAQHGDNLTIPPGGPTPIQRPGSTTTLHTQIRNLQRQLDLKTEEAVQLRRQLEVQENADVGTLSQQLREAKREAQMWKERAESAERRIKVFERFTARLKGIRTAGGTAQGAQDTTGPDCHGLDMEKGQNEACLENIAGYESDSSEDARIVSVRIQNCLDGLTDGPRDISSLSNQTQNPSSSEIPERVISPSEEEVWMAAQELLELNQTLGQIDRGESTS
ncbi:putative rho-gtpase-activating protein 6 [Fusarium flagelliforme]|uniref:Putative rho-gtpase-activating protein 6 n=1 Tax=Fusarium flagelliforme TaxID=2675880 RepID=A0A395MD90_9HYPO|nr:putative rho-gtpase-activating protein 6 [Fusarium flagelliforme]